MHDSVYVCGTTDKRKGVCAYTCVSGEDGSVCVRVCVFNSLLSVSWW